MTTDQVSGTGVLAALSNELASAVETAGKSVVRVEARRRQSASGVVWAEGGLILTADHVLERDEDIQIGTPDGRTIKATIVGRDPGTDLALLKAEATDLTPIGRGEAPKVGHIALVVARPGASLATSIGVVSSIEDAARSRRSGQTFGVVRTDATFYPGFSGGPMIDAAGRIVGLATSFGGNAGVAISLETLNTVLGSLQSHGRVRRGFLGLSSQPVALPQALRDKHSLSQETGLMVVGVEPNGPAEQGGLTIGDVLVALNGQPTSNTEDLRGLLSVEMVGKAIPARVIRGGEPKDLTVTVGERQ